MVGFDPLAVLQTLREAGSETGLVHAQVLAPKLFLNTFGGNPVCCAGGRAVLRVIDNEGLQANCAKVPHTLHADDNAPTAHALDRQAWLADNPCGGNRV